MKREFNVIIDRDTDGYFVASVPNLAGCHTQAKSLDELIERIREAIALCLEFEDEQDSLDFLGVNKLILTY
ncbi:type II toxin-antitoxin system HicB family antitoxin [Nostoc sp.]|uniref:type II toxin-antitoxin system HicB family antitoxin n=1 Tax=Nostoc sp. TaxID=1180 RepID=UPI002FF8B631